MLKDNLVKKMALVSIATIVLATSGCSNIIPEVTKTITSTVVVNQNANNVNYANRTVIVDNDFADMIGSVRSSVAVINTETSYFSFYGTYTTAGAGSGWVLSKDGIIVTNNHVVEGANTVSVTFEDGSTYPAKNIYTDPVTDLAVIIIDADNLKPLKLGSSNDLRVGEWVVAVGNSLGMGISASQGIVSAVNVTMSTSDYETLYNLIQTTAAINAGNSGGPLFNTKGEVVGITSSKMSAVGVEGMAYAISVDEALPILKQLISKGKVVRPSFGIGMYTNSPSIARRYQLAVDTGVLVTSVDKGSVADIAGIESGDVIVSVDGIKLAKAKDLSTYLQNKAVGETITVTYYHNSDVITIDIVLSQSN